MSTTNPLVDECFLDDTLTNIQGVLAVLAAAETADCRWDAMGAGVQLLLGLVADALAEATAARQPWANPEVAE